MPKTGTFLRHHVYIAILGILCFHILFSCLDIITVPHRKQNRYVPPGILRLGKVSDLLNDM